jgi:hypothetical protein
MKGIARTTSKTIDLEIDSGVFWEVVSDLDHLDTEMSHRGEGMTRFGHDICHGWEIERLKYTEIYLSQESGLGGRRRVSMAGRFCQPRTF